MKIHTVFYALGFVSVALSASQYLQSDSSDKERDGIFVGHWAPTFFIIGKILEDKEVNKRSLLE